MMRPDQMTCPVCGGIAESDSVDNGVGIQVRGNFYCEACQWCAEQPTDAELGLDDLGDELFSVASERSEESSPRRVVQPIRDDPPYERE